MELADTVELMQSEDFKERFKAEYLQTKIRTKKLRDMIVKYEAERLNLSKNAICIYWKHSYM